MWDSKQDESDTRTVLYCQYARNHDYKYVTVKGPDTDVFFILVYYAKRIENISILFEQGRRNKSRFFGTTAFSEEMSFETEATQGLQLYSQFIN